MSAVVGVCVVIGLRVVSPGGDSPTPGPVPVEGTRVVAPVDAGPAEVLAPASQSEAPGYRLNAPDATAVLSPILNEISGLSPSKEPDSLWAVHDERGTLFRISVKDGSVLQEVSLGKKGDYEGVEEVGDIVYVARSEGILLVVDPKAGGEPTRLNFQKQLGLACDLEGLAYEPKQKRLLLTCKNEGSKSRRSNKSFEIFAMDLESRKIHREAVYVLTEQQIDAYIAAHPDMTQFKKAKGNNFAPSGVAVHPETGEIYILSTRAKMVVVLDTQGGLVRAYALDPAVHPQPEGIAFGPDGTLFISSEAHGKRALLQTFKPPTAVKD